MEFSTDGATTVQALQDISFSVGRGEFLSVLGPSGCGKSTILRLAAGLETPTRGEVAMEGKVIQGPDRRRGLVFQSYSVFPWLTVQQNVAFGLTNKDRSQPDDDVQKWLDFTELTDFADAYPKTLSGGMRQRLALARTMIVEPELLLLDEPFGALDERTREGMQRLLLQAVRETGCSVIFVTHDIQEAILLADKFILLSNRPAKILNMQTVTAEKPRSRQFLRSEEFIRYHEALLDQFPT
jgi:NitT/TauT family transport system ATP-binding protein